MVSYSDDRIYAVIQNGKFKFLAFYEDHKQVKCVDFGHKHNKMQPHVHLYMNHKTAYGITNEDKKIAEKIARRYKTKWK